MAVIIAKNQTAGDLALDNLSAVDRKIPASSQVTLTSYNSETRIKEDAQLLGYIDAGNVILNIDGYDQNQADSQNWMKIPSNTDELKEGSSNLYYTEARVSANATVVAASIFGSEFQHQETDAEFSTSDTSNWQTALTLNTSSLPSGIYYIGWSCADSQFEYMYFRVQLAGVTIFEPDQAIRGSISGFKITSTISGTKAITIQIKAKDSPVGIVYRRLVVWRIS